MKNLIYVCILLVLSSCGSKKSAISTTKPSTAIELKVMSYNIHIANPPSKPGLTDMEAIIKAIKAEDPDLVALQEVDVNTARSGKINQAAIIAKALKMNYFFAKSIDHDGGDYGVCILSKYPISETKINRLTTVASTGGEPRVLATVKVHLNNGKYFRFGSTHLDAQAKSINREVQIEDIIRISKKETLPFIIAGDFNAEPGSTVINKLYANFSNSCQTCGPTIPVVKPTKTIDYIAFRMAKDFSIISHKVVQEHYASDHLPVMAIIKTEF